MASATVSRKPERHRIGRRAPLTASRLRRRRGSVAERPPRRRSRPRRMRRSLGLRLRMVPAQRSRPAVVVADAAHRGPEPRRPRRPAVAVPLCQPVPRGADRRAGAEPADPGRDHRRRHRAPRPRWRPTHHGRSRKAAAIRRRASIGAPADEDSSGLRILDQPRAASGPCCKRLVSPDRHPGPHLRPGRRSAARFARAWRCRQQRPAREPPRAAASGGAIADRADLERGEAPLRPDRSAARRGHAQAGERQDLPEVTEALTGQHAIDRSGQCQGQTIVSVAVPIRYPHGGAARCCCRRQPATSTRSSRPTAGRSFRVFLVAAGVMFVLSLFLAGTIAGPMRRLAEAAERVRRGVNSREEIPDFTSRADEIGHLSSALRDMTRGALFPHGGDRELRRRRGARTQEPADLAAQRGRDLAAHQGRGIARPADRRSSSTTSGGSIG